MKGTKAWSDKHSSSMYTSKNWEVWEMEKGTIDK